MATGLEQDGPLDLTVDVLDLRKQRAAAISASRILTDKDFSRIDAAQVRKQVQGLKASKRQAIQMEESDGLVKRFVSSSIPFFSKKMCVGFDLKGFCPVFLTCFL